MVDLFKDIPKVTSVFSAADVCVRAGRSDSSTSMIKVEDFIYHFEFNLNDPDEIFVYKTTIALSSSVEDIASEGLVTSALKLGLLNSNTKKYPYVSPAIINSKQPIQCVCFEENNEVKATRLFESDFSLEYNLKAICVLLRALIFALYKTTKYDFELSKLKSHSQKWFIQKIYEKYSEYCINITKDPLQNVKNAGAIRYETVADRKIELAARNRFDKHLYVRVL